MAKLKRMNIGGREFLVNKAVGVGPYFHNMVKHRIKIQKSTNCVVTGEPGDGKSYFAFDFCRALEGLTKSGKDRFSIKQIVFTYHQYLDLIINLPMGKPIVFDEPSYALSHREWYKTLNRALVLTMESQRFKIHPLFIPIINKALLDKVVRSYLIQYQIVIRKRGIGTVYRIEPSQSNDKIYRKTICQIQYAMLDRNLCNKPSCLGCVEFLECKVFRAQYERKKADIQNTRYEAAKDMAQKAATVALTDDQIERILYPDAEEFTEDGRIKAQMMRVIAKAKHHISLSNNRAYLIANTMKYNHPEEFT